MQPMLVNGARDLFLIRMRNYIFDDEYKTGDGCVITKSRRAVHSFTSHAGHFVLQVRVEHQTLLQTKTSL